MRIRRWLMAFLIALATVTAAQADEPGRRTGAAPSNAAIETKAGDVHEGDTAEPIQGSYQFLLEVAGVTPDQPSQTRKSFVGASPRRDSRVLRRGIDSTN